MKRFIKLLISILLVAQLGGVIPLAQAQSSYPDSNTIQVFLENHPLLLSTGTQVRQVLIQGEALVIDLSVEFLPGGEYDDEIFSRLQFDLDQALDINSYYMTTFKIEGLSLEDWGRPLPDIGSFDWLPPLRENTITGPLSGYKIALNPGHGIYLNETYGWIWQRGVYYTIREDIVNAEIVHLLTFALTNLGATVIDIREQDKNAHIGSSGLQTWYEAARHFAQYEGLPSSVWNGAIAPWNTNYNDDIRARPYIANYYDADLLINFHNNGYDGTFSGTETYYDTSGDYSVPALSGALATAVHNSIISTIRSKYNAAWVNRGIKTSDGNYGEIHYATMPSILLELAFMDKLSPDNTALKDSRFRVFAVEAIVDGICNYLGKNCGDVPITRTQYLETPTLTPDFNGDMCSSGWASYTNQRAQSAYLTPNVIGPISGTHAATWETYIPLDGLYHIEALIPSHDPLRWTCPEMTLETDSANAVYHIQHKFGTTTINVDQSSIANDWLDLGVYYFKTAADGLSVTLTNATGEPLNTSSVSFSALRLNLVGTIPPVFIQYFPLGFN